MGNTKNNLLIAVTFSMASPLLTGIIYIGSRDCDAGNILSSVVCIQVLMVFLVFVIATICRKCCTTETQM
jgi:hypothetical protein